MTDEESLKEYMMKEVEIIQGIIGRMASNSFIIKGWALTLVVVSLVLERQQVAIAFIPLLTFWLLDAYFLWQERMYRKLYAWVTKNRLKTDDHLLDMDAQRFRGEVQSRFRTMFSITLGWFYGSIAFLIAIYGTYLFLLQGAGCRNGKKSVFQLSL